MRRGRRPLVAPVAGWRGPDQGRTVTGDHAVEYQGTTVQIAGLYPFVAGSGAPSIGVPLGRHMLWGESVCLDPLLWLEAGLVTNPGVFILGQPGVGKSTIAKRLVTGMVGFGAQAIVLGDTKPDYTRLVEHLGGQVIRAGRGMDRINPLDKGPLGAVLARMGSRDAERLRLEIKGRRMSLMLALCALVRGSALTNPEEVLLGRAVDVVSDRVGATVEPTIPDLLAVVDQGPDELRAAVRATNDREYRLRSDSLVPTLTLLCDGQLSGVFDGPTTRPLDLRAPAVSVDISRLVSAGDQLVSAAMLCTWAYSFAMMDAAAVLTEQRLEPPRRFVGVMDELWRALRGASGLVEHADALTRLNRQRGMASIMITHSMADLEALPTASDRTKARGFVERSAITVLAGLPPRELERVNEVVPLTQPEMNLVRSWAAPESWMPRSVHPGRGKYLIKTGERIGIPVELTLVGAEFDLYDTEPLF